MISDYIQNKLELAKYKILEDGTYFGMIKGLRGVWADAKTLEQCREELKEVLEDWLVLQIASGKLNIKRKHLSHA